MTDTCTQRIESEIEFAFNNTYGVQAITQENYEWSIHEFYRPGGALDGIKECRELQRTIDPHDHGDQAKVNRICAEADERALNISDGLFVREGRAARFDITHDRLDPFPPPYMFGWLNQPEVQKAFGVPVNHSWYSPAVARAFDSTGDHAKGGQLDQLAFILGR